MSRGFRDGRRGVRSARMVALMRDLRYGRYGQRGSNERPDSDGGEQSLIPFTQIPSTFIPRCMYSLLPSTHLDLSQSKSVPSKIRSTSPHPPPGGILYSLNHLTPTRDRPSEPSRHLTSVAHPYPTKSAWIPNKWRRGSRESSATTSGSIPSSK